MIIAGRKSDEFYVGLLWTDEQKALWSRPHWQTHKYFKAEIQIVHPLLIIQQGRNQTNPGCFWKGNFLEKKVFGVFLSDISFCDTMTGWNWSILSGIFYNSVCQRPHHQRQYLTSVKSKQNIFSRLSVSQIKIWVPLTSLDVHPAFVASKMALKCIKKSIENLKVLLGGLRGLSRIFTKMAIFCKPS